MKGFKDVVIALAVFVFTLSLCSLDGSSWVPLATMFVSGAVIAGIAWYEGEEERRRRKGWY
jgi:hypothetical protein